MPKPPIKFKKKRRIEVSTQLTVNLGNYQSLKVQASYSEDIMERADVDEKYNSAWNIVNYQVETAVEEHLNEGDQNASTQTGIQRVTTPRAGGAGSSGRNVRNQKAFIERKSFSNR